MYIIMYNYVYKYIYIYTHKIFLLSNQEYISN